MITLLWNGLCSLLADACNGIVQFGAQARHHLTRADLAHGLLIGLGSWLADGLTDDPLLVWLDNGLELGVVLGAATLGARWAFSTRTATRWRIVQQFIESMAILALVRIGVGFFGPAVMDMIRTMPMESLMLGIAFRLVWLVVWPKRGCRCHAD